MFPNIYLDTNSYISLDGVFILTMIAGVAILAHAIQTMKD